MHVSLWQASFVICCSPCVPLSCFICFALIRIVLACTIFSSEKGLRSEARFNAQTCGPQRLHKYRQVAQEMLQDARPLFGPGPTPCTGVCVRTLALCHCVHTLNERKHRYHLKNHTTQHRFRWDGGCRPRMRVAFQIRQLQCEWTANLTIMV